MKVKSDYEIAKEEKEKNQEKELPPTKKIKNMFSKTLETHDDPNAIQNSSLAQGDAIEKRLKQRLSQYGDDPAQDLIAKFEKQRQSRIRDLEKQQ